MSQEQSGYKFIKVYSTNNQGELALIKSILDGQKIKYFVKGENFSSIYGAANGLTSMDIMVREDIFTEANELLKGFINPPPK